MDQWQAGQMYTYPPLLIGEALSIPLNVPDKAAAFPGGCGHFGCLIGAYKPV